MAGFEPNRDFDAFTLSDEHRMLRDAVRELTADVIAPRAAEIDETGEFPWDVYRALVSADFHAIHVPEKFGGQGGDAADGGGGDGGRHKVALGDADAADEEAGLWERGGGMKTGVDPPPS